MSCSYFFALEVLQQSSVGDSCNGNSRCQNIIRIAPTIFRHAGPGCLKGRCPEGAYTCGEMKGVREFFKENISFHFCNKRNRSSIGPVPVDPYVALSLKHSSPCKRIPAKLPRSVTFSQGFMQESVKTDEQRDSIAFSC